MGTFKAYFKKEILESLRQYKYVVLAVGIMFFSIADPIMMKLLPSMLKAQLHGDLSSLFITNRRIVMQSYVNHLFQLGAMFVVFTAANSLSDEISTKKFVFPYVKGSSPIGIVMAKLSHYSITITILTICGFTINHYYTNILFRNDTVAYKNVLISACLISIYYIFNIILATFFSSLLKKGIAAGFITIGIGYFSTLLNSFGRVGDYIPYKLVANASTFNNLNSLKVLAFVSICSIVLIILTIFRMSKVEVA
jgi:ABC-2 type transport system permease protein